MKKKKYYKNKSTPLDLWNKEVDPAIMSGQHWEREGHQVEEEDVGWKTDENQDLRQGIPPQGVPFMHPVHDVSYDKSTAKEKSNEE